jgi:deoxycytidylate deaminase
MLNHEVLPEGAGKCAKQTTTALVIKDGEGWYGSNWCHNPQQECPRKGLPTGEGYEMCRDICKQNAHAEVNACRNAGENAKGATLFLMGHYYACDDCKRVCDEAGIAEIVIEQER